MIAEFVQEDVLKLITDESIFLNRKYLLLNKILFIFIVLFQKKKRFDNLNLESAFLKEDYI